MNKVILVGRLVRDPELRKTPSGKSVASASLATSERYTDKNGVAQQQSEFHNLVIWGKQGENMAQYTHKGSKLLIEGKMTTRQWTGQDGIKRYSTEVLVSNCEFLDSKPQEARAEQAPYSSNSDENTMPTDEEITDFPPDDEISEEIRVENIPF